MKDPIRLFAFLLACLFCQTAHAQHNNSQLPTSIRTDGAPPDASAVFDVQSTEKGMLLPRMTTAERDNIPNPHNGLLIYNTDISQFNYYDKTISGAIWVAIDPTDNQLLSFDANSSELSIEDGNSVDLTPLTNKEVDYSTYFGYPACPAPETFLISTDFLSAADCGNLYDSGGPAGEYGANEDEQFHIFGPGDLFFRVILHSLDVDPNGNDTLFIGNHVYTEDITTPDTFFLGETLFRFTSDNLLPAAGFHISWKRLQYQGGNSTNPNGLGFFFNAEKQAVGGGVEVDGAWGNVGKNAVLFGYHGKASGQSSTSVGYMNEATGFRSSVFGYLNDGTGEYGSAFGTYNEAAGNESNAFGYANNATGTRSGAFGYSNEAAGFESSAFGHSNTATNFRSYAFGGHNTVTGDHSSAFGRSNEATGGISSAFGSHNEATGDRSSAFGLLNEATGEKSNAFGYDNEATGERSNAFGHFNSATGIHSSAFGYNTLSGVYRCMAIGNYNVAPTGSPDTWIPTDPSFMIGNGQLGSRSTAVTILKNGKVGIGTVTPAAPFHLTHTLAGDPRVHGLRIQNGGGANYLTMYIFNSSGDMSLYTNQGNGGNGFIGSFDAQTGVYTTVSDARAKANVQDLPTILPKLTALRPVSYHFKKDESREQQIGFLAQELQEVFPQFVSHNVEQDVYSVDYAGLSTVALKAVQEQQAVIEEQQNTIKGLQSKNIENNGRMAELESQVRQLFSLLGKPGAATSTKE